MAALFEPSLPDNWITHYNTSAAHIAASVERSLTNLDTDYLDLLLLHRPVGPNQAASAAGFVQAANTFARGWFSTFTSTISRSSDQLCSGLTSSFIQSAPSR